MNFIPQYKPDIRKSYCDAVYRQMLSGWVGPGKATAAFEAKLRDIVGMKYVLATTSGTTALIMAIGSLSLKKGSTILFPAYTFLAGANAARYLGHKVRLVDIKRDTLSMDPDKIRITRDVGAVMFVNHNGHTGPDVRAVKRLCEHHGIPMIEDSSQGLGIHGAGTVGDVSVLSFSACKLVTTGQGGAVMTRDAKIYLKLRQIRDHGDNWRKDRLHRHLGVNFKFNDIHAAYGLAQLEILDDLRLKRSLIYDWYSEEIAIDHTYSQRIGDSPWIIIHRSNKAKAIISALAGEGIEAVQYYRPVASNPVYATKEKYPVADAIYRTVVYLPSFLSLTRKDVKRICRIIKNVH